MSEMLLLGAGASVTAGVPSTYDMTKEMLGKLQENRRFSVHTRVLQFVIGGLLFQAGKQGKNPLVASVNIEDLFNAVQLLAQRYSLEAAPFVGSWDDMVEELDRPQPGSVDLDKAIYDSIAQQISRALSTMPSSTLVRNINNAFTSAFNKSLEAAIKNRSVSLFGSEQIGNAVEAYIRAVSDGWKSELRRSFGMGRSAGEAIERRLQQQTGRGQGHVYEETNEIMIAALKDLVWISQDQKLDYLGPILNLLDNQKRLVVASLNYDNAIELLCTSQQRKYQTGIESWAKNGQFSCDGDGLHLLKMHGSIDWHKVQNEYSIGQTPTMPHIGIRQVSSDEFSKRYFMPAVIFGQRNKLTAEGPFLDLLRAFQNELAKVQTLTIVGYSFRDPHVNVYISQWLNGSSDRVLQIINGDRFLSDRSEYVDLLMQFRKDMPDRIKIISHFAKEGLAEVYGSYNGIFGQKSALVSSAVETALHSPQENGEETPKTTTPESGLNTNL